MNGYIGLTHDLGQAEQMFLIHVNIYLFSMEVIGKYPSIEVGVEFKVQGNVPVWIPTKQRWSQFSDKIRNGFVDLRKANILARVNRSSQGLTDSAEIF